MVYDVLPTTNLKYDDVRDTLNSAGGSVNNIMSSLFTEAANIDVWSKRKPVRLNVDFCQDFDSSAPNYNATWEINDDVLNFTYGSIAPVTLGFELDVSANPNTIVRVDDKTVIYEKFE